MNRTPYDVFAACTSPRNKGKRAPFFLFILITIISLSGLVAPQALLAAPGDITTIAGGGAGDSVQATSASLYLPRGIHVTASGDIYIADTLNHRVRKIDTNGIITTVAGNGRPGFSGDGGVATSASLNRPLAVTVDPAGNIFIADAHNHRVRKVNTSGIISTIIGGGADNAANYCSLPAADVSNLFARDIFLDSSRRLYINDGQLWRFEADGTLINLSDATCGYGSLEPGFSGGFFDASGAFVYASGNNIFRTTDMHTSSLLGAFSTVSPGPFPALSGDAFGNIYVAFPQSNIIYKLDPTGTSTVFAGTGAAGYSGDGGNAVSANINNPTDVFADASGNVYIADRMNHRIRKVDPNGTITTAAGTGEAGYAGDGLTAVSESLNLPRGVFVDSAGNVYVADTYNHRVRKIDTAGIVTTIAGTGAAEFSGDGGPANAAGLYYPNGIFAQADGTIYIADSFNDRIRRIDPAGTITTIAGTDDTGYDGDGGPAQFATLHYPTGIVADSTGNILIADFGNNAIRKIDTSGIISTYVNIFSPRSIAIDSSGVLYVATSYDGINKVYPDGTVDVMPSCIDAVGVSVDAAGTVYMACQGDNTIEAATPGMAPGLVAGTGDEGFSGDGGPASAARLFSPSSVFVAASGVLYITDSENNRVRRIEPGFEIVPIPPSVTLYSPSDGLITPETTPLLWYTASNGTVVVKVDGVVVNIVSGRTLGPLADGQHTVRVEATDSNGTGFDERTFTVDTTAPVISILSPQAGSSANNTPVLRFSVNEAVSMVYARLDSTYMWIRSGETLGTLSEGQHSLMIVAMDYAWNTGTAVVNFTIDSTPPTVSINPVTTPTYVDSQTITGSREADAVITVTANTAAFIGSILYPTSTTWTCEITALVEGETSITVTATDAASNSATVSASITHIRDLAPPAGLIVINNGSGTTNTTSVILAITCSDPDSGCSQMQFSNDGVIFSTPESVASSKNWLLSSGDGPKMVFAKFKDNAGNWSEPIPAAIVLDTQAPIGFLAINAAGWQLSTIDNAGAEAGGFVSAATDSQRNVHMSYVFHNGLTRILKYATNSSGQWQTTIVDGSLNGEVDGNAMALDGSGTVHIAYTGDNYDLKYATNGSGSWQTYSIETQGDVGRGPSIAVDNNGKVSIAYYNNTTGGVYIKYATNASGQWQTSFINSIPYAVGASGYDRGTAVSLDPAGNVHVCFVADGNLYYALHTNGQWEITLLSLSAADPSMAIDVNGTVHISYSHNGITYVNNATGTWVPELVTPQGGLPRIVVDSEAKVHLSYLGSQGGISYATNRTGSWLVYPYIEDGIFSSIVVDSANNVAVAYEGPNRALKIAQAIAGSLESKATTSSQSITLLLAAQDVNGVEQMQFSNDAAAWSNPESYATTKAWLLDPGDGTKTVYTKFKDSAGNWSDSYSASIALDTSAPAMAISSPTAGIISNKTPLLTYTGSEGVTAVKVDGNIVNKVSGNTLDPLSEGTHTVRVESTDAAGNTGYAEVSFIVDTVPPVISINPVNATTNVNSQTITGAREGGAIIAVTLNTAATAGAISYPNDTTWSCAINGLIEGSNAITVTATDAAGNSGSAGTSITYDSVAPAVAISSPSVGTMNNNGPVLTYSVSDGTVVVKVDGNIVQKISGNMLDTLTDGIHVVRVEATDGAGNTGFAEVTFTIDTVSPVVTISSPAVGTTRNNSPLLTYTASDGAVVVRVDGEVVPKISGTTLGPLADGTHTVRVDATDTAGNTGFAEVTFTVDTIPPSVSITPVTTPTNVSNQTITGTREENATISISVNTSASVGGITYPSSTTWSCTVSNLASGTNTVTVTATDAAGNPATAAANITLDTIAPTVSITSPGSAPTNDNTPLLTYSASDGTVVVKVDGVVVSKVSGDSLDMLPDGSHTVRVESTDAAGNTGSAQVSFIVDTVVPAISIDPVTTPTRLTSQTITGTRESGASVSATVSTSATVGPVSYDSATTWSCTISNLVRGSNVITARAVDAAGNGATATAAITKK